ncbi:hypothetical protein [Pseudolactococcus paracarnosus]|uniref:Uncharacterized protein n=1 Tax=Pseudolactococcus paracarnosus TaxID=2749962 RepID=A0ABT0AJK7_9LACT|nr:hypothetical protein [Lactococcus paracarnosus]MCJ1976736.1 hypothetical protein [Lactococcus paracarnosus]MCJ1982878.1 hypothetical protein [Lactococcus paracarnosus]MCJ1997391.1 hypothetical protein [Lactococcus paracarnosus]
MEKCLRQTPQNVDLWLTYLKNFPNKKSEQTKYVQMLEEGYFDLEVFKRSKFKKSDDTLIVALTVCLYFNQNLKIARHFCKKITEENLRNRVHNIIEVPNV